ncbi:MAG: hypothetical protein ACK48P_04930 [Holosporales bacterium]|jgi:hypothetical protein
MMIEETISKIPNMCYPGDPLAYADGLQNQAKSTVSCLKEFLGVCFEKPNNPSGIEIFGFSEFVAALALLMLIYQITDVRYRFHNVFWLCTARTMCSLC